MDQYEAAPSSAVVEWSADAALMVEVDCDGGDVRVALEPEALRSLPADLLADRIARLHRLALMRARADKRRELVEQGNEVAHTAGFPTHTDVNEYRRTIDF